MVFYLTIHFDFTEVDKDVKTLKKKELLVHEIENLPKLK